MAPQAALEPAAVNGASSGDSQLELIERARSSLRSEVSLIARAGIPQMRNAGLGASLVASLGLSTWLPIAATLVLAGSISLTMGIGRGTVGIIRTLVLVALGAGALAFAVASQRGLNRRWAVWTSLGLVVVGLAVASAATLTVTLGAGLAVAGFGAGAGASVQYALLVDVGTPSARPRRIAWHRSWALAAPPALLAASLLAPGAWRAGLLMAAVAALLPGPLLLRFEDPGCAAGDGGPIRARVNQYLGSAPSTAEEGRFTVVEGFQRLFRSKAAVGALAMQAISAAVVLPTLFLGDLLLWQQYGLPERQRHQVTAVALLLALPLVALIAGSFRRGKVVGPRGALRRLSGLPVWGAAGLLLAAHTSLPAAAVVGFAMAIGVFVALEAPTIDSAVMSLPAGVRNYLAAGCVLGFALGAVQGLALVTSLSGRYGPSAAFTVLALLAATAAGTVARIAGAVEDESGTVLDGTVEDQVIRSLSHSGAELPLLACRQVDFSYGPLQVLFGVDFEVAEGEMVGLLGTNGAGKSTLLRVVSGLGHPDQGTVRFLGQDLTDIDATRRVRAGVLQIPGGRATFPRMSVLDNLRSYAYLLGRDRMTFERRLDEVFEIFPRLAERRGQSASTLSGGEAQMLGLSKAFLLRPRLLLIDELSLGLSPKIVGELIALVRRINATGTAVVLVEQSVNIALSLVDHVYFMEKGRIRFDGAADELLGRDDLLRSVFLQGAGVVAR